MKIKNIEIENFRSYYGKNNIDIGDNLTLIVGGNGDGKTTFFDAIYWLLDTVKSVPVASLSYVSRKCISTLPLYDSAQVRVAMTFEHNGDKTLEKRFTITKRLSEEEDAEDFIEISDFQHNLYEHVGVENKLVDNQSTSISTNKAFDQIFDPALRRYSLFRGEEELEIFKNKDAIDTLVKYFSIVGKFDNFISFNEFAVKTANRAANNAQKTTKKNELELNRLKLEIDRIENRIDNLKREKRTKLDDITNYQQLLDGIESSSESAALVKDLNGRISKLEEERAKVQSRIQDNYTIYLLDKYWILCGFDKIANEFTAKVSKVEQERRRLNAEYFKKLGAQEKIDEFKQQLADGIVPLEPYVPDEKTMREMLNDHVCKVCGTPAPEGSAAYEFMKRRLNEYLESIRPKTPKDDEENKDLYQYDYIIQLDKLSTILNNNIGKIKSMPSEITDRLELNERLRQDLEKINKNITDSEDEKAQVLAQNQSFSEEELLNAYTNIKNWAKFKADAENRARDIEKELVRLGAELQENKDRRKDISIKSPSAMYERSAEALELIQQAFLNARERNKNDFLITLEKVSNEFLAKLNVDDFTGNIRIVPMPNGKVIATLIDDNKIVVDKPNKALETTMYMSILFAVAQLTAEKNENSEFPLIFDAPTSSFMESKEKDFFKLIANLDKQTIIVTKSFLKEIEPDVYAVDQKAIDEIKSQKGIRVYHIVKARPFDNKKLETIITNFELIAK